MSQEIKEFHSLTDYIKMPYWEITMKIGLLIIASEVLDGKITDLNTRYLAEYLKGQNLELEVTTTVRDREDDILKGLADLFQSAQLVISSGGLGPTKDDLTKKVIGQYFEREHVYSPAAHQVAETNYQRLNRTYPGKEHGYSFLPEGFLPLENATGFAPGFYAEGDDKFLIAAPGVPREFKSIINDHLGNWIKKNIQVPQFMENIIIRTKKVPEEKIFGEVDPFLWDKLEAFGDVSSLPVLMGVDIGVKIKASGENELTLKKQAVFQIIKDSPICSSVWNWGPEKLEEVIVMRANELGLKFGFAESCTGGLCSQRITNVSGSSKSFFGSVICYDTAVKINQLNVSPLTISNKGVVSTETAEEMATGLARLWKLDLAISTTGIAGPNGGTIENPVGTVCIGIHSAQKQTSIKLHLFGDREQLKERFAQAALMALWETMEEFA